MTDEQIINALKSCGDRIAICDDCPYEGRNHCSLLAKQDIIERFTELKSENAALRERLSKAVELPCKVGDKLFVVMPELYGNQIIEALVNQIIFNHGETQILVYYDIHQEGRIHRLYESYFGKTLFFTRESAEARLAELKGEKE